MKPFFLAALALGVLSACSGQSNETEHADAVVSASPEIAKLKAGAFPHEVSDLPVDPDVIYGRLDNGMRYAIRKNETPPRQAAIRLRIDMGSLAEADDQRGLAHFLEHMAFNGSTNVPEGEMVPLLERFGLAFGPDTNAYTSFDETVYQLDLPEVNEEIVDTALFLMRETASELTIDSEAVDRERGVVKSEERFRNTANLRRFTDLWSFAYPGARFPDRFPIGTVDVLENAPAGRIKDLYRAYYRPERAFLVVVGDIEPEAIEEKIKDKFGDWKGKDKPGKEPALGDVDINTEIEAHFFQDPDVTTSVSLIAAQPYVAEIDDLDFRQERVLEMVAFGALDRRFARLSRQPDASFVQAGADYDRLFETVSTASVSIFSQSDKWQAALATAEQELRRALEHGFTASEVNEQVANIRNVLQEQVKGANTRQSASLANHLTSSLNNDTVVTTPEGSLERFSNFEPQVTPEAVHEVFKKRWGDQALRIHLSHPEEIKNAEAKILAAYRESLATEVTRPAEDVAKAFAYTEFGAPGEVIAREVDEELGLTKLRFANNVRVNLKPTDFEDARIRATLRFGGGQLEQPLDKPGLDTLMNLAFTNGGLKAHSLDELQSIFAGRNVSMGISAGFDAFSASSSTTSDDLLTQLQIWAAFVTAPGFREEGKTQFDQLVNAVYDTIDGTPQGVQNVEVARIIRSGDPRFGLASKEDLAARTLEEVRDFYSRSATEGYTELSFVGEFNEQAVIDAVAATFGALPKRRAKPAPQSNARSIKFPMDQLGTQITLHHEGLPNRALALMYWPTFDASDARKRANMTLTEQVFSLKLTERIREELGATYSPSSYVFYDPTVKDYGYLGVSLDLEPSAVDYLYEVVFEIIEDMRNGEITEDERKRALQPVLEQIEESLENNAYWLGLIDRAQAHPRDLEYHRNRAGYFSETSVEDMVELSNTYLTNDRVLKIQILPPVEGQ